MQPLCDVAGVFMAEGNPASFPTVFSKKVAVCSLTPETGVCAKGWDEGSCQFARVSGGFDGLG